MSTLAAVVEHLPVPVILATSDGMVVTASHASEALLGTIDVGSDVHAVVDGSEAGGRALTHEVIADGEPHLLVELSRCPPAPADVAALARATAHDFNNLLGVIINFASLAASQVPEGSGAAQDLQEVLVASRRAATLTQRLLQIGGSSPDHVSS